MKIGDLAKLTGLSASRIRFYEAKGLLTLVDRGANGYRDYPPEAALILAIIITAQQCGFSLDEIRALIPVDLATWSHADLGSSLRRKITEIDAMQERLAANKANLVTLIAAIDAKPDGIGCADNARRVLDGLRSA